MNQVCTRPRRSEGKELKCLKCGKEFKGITARDYHIKRKVCEQAFPRRRSKTVAGPPYSCKWCNTLFNVKQTCYVHMARKACIRFPDKYALKNKGGHSILGNLEVTLYEGDSAAVKLPSDERGNEEQQP